MTDSTPLPAAQHQAVLQQLAANYAAISRLSAQQGGITYLPTWQLAKGQTADDVSVKAVVIGASHAKLWAFAILGVVLGFICLQWMGHKGVKDIYRYPISSAFLLLSVGAVRGIRDKKNRLTIDETGLLYHQWQDGIPWHRVLGMWVATAYKANQYEELTVVGSTLLVHYYDERFDDYFSREADLDGFDEDPKTIAFLLEHIKQQAGFPSVESY
jgi:hypothetical protein